MRQLVVFCVLFFWAFTNAESHPGIGIVMDSKGNVFYTDLTHVWKITPDGKRIIAVRNVHTHELYMDKDDNLYGEHEYYNGEALDTWGNYVWCLDSKGEFKKIIPDVVGFLDNNTLTRDSKGNSFWAEKSGKQEILNKQTISGKNIPYSNHRFNDIRWMYFSEDDNNLYVVDNLEIKKVSPNGDVKVIAENLKESGNPFEGVADRHYVFGVWTDRNKNVYVAVYGAGKVKKIDATGTETTVFESSKGWSPCGGITAPDGSMWIMEFSKNNTTRVRKINPSGIDQIFES